MHVTWISHYITLRIEFIIIQFHVTAVGLGMYYPHIQGSTCTAICYLNSDSSHFPTVLMTSIRDQQPVGLLSVSCIPQIPGISSEIQIHKQFFFWGGAIKYSVVFWVVAYLLVCRARRAEMQDDARNFTINTHGFYAQYLRRERVFWQTLNSTTNELGWWECRTTGENSENLIINLVVKIIMYILFK